MSEAAEQQQNNTIGNSWSNYETYLVNLWLTNDQSNYSILIEALNIKDKTIINQANYLKKHLSWQLEDEIEESGLWQDLLNCAFDRINWIEIINNNLDLID